MPICDLCKELEAPRGKRYYSICEPIMKRKLREGYLQELPSRRVRKAEQIGRPQRSTTVLGGVPSTQEMDYGVD